MSKIQNFCGRHISISPKIFLLEMENNDRRRQSFFGTLVQCLLDFTELSPSALVALFMQESFAGNMCMSRTQDATLLSIKVQAFSKDISPRLDL